MMNIKEMLKAVRENSQKANDTKEDKIIAKNQETTEVMEQKDAKKIMVGAQMPLVIDGVEDIHTVVLSGKYRDVKNANGEVVATEPRGKIYVDRVYYGDFFGRNLVCFAWKRKGMTESIVKVNVVDGQLVPMDEWWALATLFYGSTETAEDAVYNEQVRMAEEQERRGYFCELIGEDANGTEIYLVGRGKDSGYPFGQIQDNNGNVLGYVMHKYGNAPVLALYDENGEKQEIKYNPYKDKDFPGDFYKAVVTKLYEVFGRDIESIMPKRKTIKPMAMVSMPVQKAKAPKVELQAVDLEKK